MNYKKEIDSLEYVLEKMMFLFSSKHGLANCLSVDEMSHKNIKKDFGTLVIANVIPVYRTYFSSMINNSYNGSGAALTKEKSQVKAMGEFIERFCAGNFLNDHVISLHYNTYEKQSKSSDCLNILELLDFDESAYSCKDLPIVKYFDNRVVSWVKGKDMIHNREVWLPAQKVFLGIPLLNGELPYLQWLSTGLACGSAFSNAVISGIYEVVERDSFMLTWLLRLSGTAIVVDRIKNLELMKLYKHITNHLVGNDTLCIYDISRTDGIYTILTFIKNDNPDSFGIITSAASDIDPEQALLKALEELCLTQTFAYSMLYKNKQSIERVKTMKKTDVKTLHDHLLYYGTGKNSHEFDFIYATNSRISLSEMKSYVTDLNEDESVDFIFNLFREQGRSIYSIDLTRPEILECGLNVVRVIIPGYNDLDMSHNMRLLNNKRLLLFKEKYNCCFNDSPHPFP